MRKKGQMEMVGLAVIVIILILAFLLFVGLNRGKDTSAITAKESLYANNLLNAIMLYSLDEGQVSDYVKKCYEDTGSSYCDVGDEIDSLMNDGILRENQNYELLFEEDCGEMDNINEGECEEEYITASPYYVRTKGGVCTVRLRLC